MGHPPSVDQLARSIADVDLPHPLLVDAARDAIGADDPDSARFRAEQVRGLLLGPLINATGVLLHTNLGRAPLEWTQPASYSNLELDLRTGVRGSRNAHAGTLIARAASAEAALVVNNGAAAVMLVLATLAEGLPVPVSRGELVEIGGGFRVPEVMAQSGAQLVEVGTTNRTRLSDYERALATHDDVAVVLKVHPSNYRIEGFTESVSMGELATLGPPVVVDLGSGLLDEACQWLPHGPPQWIRDEPAVAQTLAGGADVVTFSGDKLLGGPQAGIIAGRKDLIDRCARHPLMRALRPGALVLAALQATALAYLRRDHEAIPFWRMASVSTGELRARAEALGVGEVAEITSVAGAGSLPGFDIPSAGVVLPGDIRDELRTSAPPVIARVHEDATILDLRTVDPSDDQLVAKACM